MSVITLTKNNFDDEVISSPVPVLIDFWASWCAPCRMLSPIIDKVADEAGDRAKVCKINVDDNPELAQRFDIMSIPTLIVMKNGKLAGTSMGIMPKEEILKMIDL